MSKNPVINQLDATSGIKVFNRELMIKNIDYKEKKLNLRDSDIERKAGLNEGYLSRLRNSTSIPGADKVILIASVLGTKAEELGTVDFSALSKFEMQQVSFLQKVSDDYSEGRVELKSFAPNEVGSLFSHYYDALSVDVDFNDGRYDPKKSTYLYNSKINGQLFRIVGETFTADLGKNREMFFIGASANPAIDALGVVECYISDDTGFYPFATSADQTLVGQTVLGIYRMFISGNGIERAKGNVTSFMNSYMGDNS